MNTHRVLLMNLIVLISPIATIATDVSFDFTLAKPASTSAGAYDADGKLVRVLWTMEKLDAGKFTRQWDGRDDLGRQDKIAKNSIDGQCDSQEAISLSWRFPT